MVQSSIGFCGSWSMGHGPGIQRHHGSRVAEIIDPGQQKIDQGSVATFMVAFLAPRVSSLVRRASLAVFDSDRPGDLPIHLSCRKKATLRGIS